MKQNCGKLWLRFEPRLKQVETDEMLECRPNPEHPSCTMSDSKRQQASARLWVDGMNSLDSAFKTACGLVIHPNHHVHNEDKRFKKTTTIKLASNIRGNNREKFDRSLLEALTASR